MSLSAYGDTPVPRRTLKARNAVRFLGTDVVVTGLLAGAVTAFGLEVAMRLAERVLVPWNGKA